MRSLNSLFLLIAKMTCPGAGVKKSLVPVLTVIMNEWPNYSTNTGNKLFFSWPLHYATLDLTLWNVNIFRDTIEQNNSTRINKMIHKVKKLTLPKNNLLPKTLSRRPHPYEIIFLLKGIKIFYLINNAIPQLGNKANYY